VPIKLLTDVLGYLTGFDALLAVANGRVRCDLRVIAPTLLDQNLLGVCVHRCLRLRPTPIHDGSQIDAAAIPVPLIPFQYCLSSGSYDVGPARSIEILSHGAKHRLRLETFAALLTHQYVFILDAERYGSS
jgi:hypothetical protein